MLKYVVIVIMHQYMEKDGSWNTVYTNKVYSTKIHNFFHFWVLFGGLKNQLKTYKITAQTFSMWSVTLKWFKVYADLHNTVQSMDQKLSFAANQLLSF